MLLGPILLAGLLAAGTVQTPPPVAQADYRFPSGAGLLFFYVKPDKTADFEAVVARLSEVLDKTEDPVRKPKAANWHILRSVEATRDGHAGNGPIPTISTCLQKHLPK